MPTTASTLATAAFAACCAAVCALQPAQAQTPAPPPAISAAPVVVQPDASPADDAASVPAKRRPEPRLMSPVENRDRTAVPGELRPERQVTPQLSIPVGPTAPSALSLDAAKPGLRRPIVKPPTSGTVQDATARCSAEVDDQARARCMEGVVRPMDRTPGGPG